MDLSQTIIFLDSSVPFLMRQYFGLKKTRPGEAGTMLNEALSPIKTSWTGSIMKLSDPWWRRVVISFSPVTV